MTTKVLKRKGKISLPGRQKPSPTMRIPEALFPAIHEIVTAYRYRVGIDTARPEAEAEKITAAVLLGEAASVKGVLKYAIEKLSILQKELEELEKINAN